MEQKPTISQQLLAAAYKSEGEVENMEALATQIQNKNAGLYFHMAIDAMRKASRYIAIAHAEIVDIQPTAETTTEKEA